MASSAPRSVKGPANIQQFLFLRCDGRSGHCSSQSKQLANRHVQVDYRSRNRCQKRRQIDQAARHGRAREDSTTKIKSMKSSAVWRQALYGRCFDLYRGDEELPVGCAFVAGFAGESRATELALDSLGLVATGNAMGSALGRSLVHRAQEKYIEALSCMQALANNRTGIGTPKPLLVPLYILQLCEMFEGIATHFHGWRSHTGAIDAVLTVCMSENEGIEQMKDTWEDIGEFQMPFGGWLALIYECEMGICCEAGAFRPTNHGIGTAKWLDGHLWRHLKDASVAVQRLKTLRRGFTQDAVSLVAGWEAVDDALEVERGLRDYMSPWPYHQASRRPLQELRPIMEQQSNAADGLVFLHVYHFQDLVTALRHVHYWMGLLSLRRSMLDLSLALPEHAQVPPVQCGPFIRQADSYADSICMSLEYLALPDHGLAGAINCMAPLELVKRWFVDRGDARKVLWCANATQGLKRKGLVGNLLLADVPEQRLGIAVDDFQADESLAGALSAA